MPLDLSSSISHAQNSKFYIRNGDEGISCINPVTAFFADFFAFFCCGYGTISVSYQGGVYNLYRKDFATWIQANGNGLDSDKISQVAHNILTQSEPDNIADLILMESKNLPARFPKLCDLILNSTFLSPHIKNAYIQAMVAQQGQIPQIKIKELSEEDLRAGVDINELNRHTCPIELYRNLRIDAQQTFYEYPQDTVREKNYHVDFANQRLGGKCFLGCVAQEENLVYTMPNLAETLAANLDQGNESRQKQNMTNILTRTAKSGITEDHQAARPGNGRPNPKLILNCTRTTEITSAYANSQVTVKALDQPQNVNLLAMAAPNLSGLDHQEFKTDTLNDLYETFYAGFLLAKKDADSENKDCIVCTGKIGCGIFRNNPLVVMLLQTLAAQELGIHVKFYGYSDAEVNEVKIIWDGLKDAIMEQRHTQNPVKGVRINDNRYTQINKDPTVKEILSMIHQKFTPPQTPENEGGSGNVGISVNGGGSNDLPG